MKRRLTRSEWSVLGVILVGFLVAIWWGLLLDDWRGWVLSGAAGVLAVEGVIYYRDCRDAGE